MAISRPLKMEHMLPSCWGQALQDFRRARARRQETAPWGQCAYTQHHFSAVFCHVSVISLLHLWRLEHVPSETECWGAHPGLGFSLFSGKKINTIIIIKKHYFFVIIERVLWPARHGATMRETSALPVLTMQQCTGPSRQGREYAVAFNYHTPLWSSFRSLGVNTQHTLQGNVEGLCCE